jgi:HTH-type transcriptional regulator/antitoxin HigA
MYSLPMKDEFKSPGQLITHLVEQRGWSKRVLSTVLDMSETVVNKMTTDVRPISATDAILLEDVFNVPASTFLDLQSRYDLAKARIKSAPDQKRSERALLFNALPIASMVKRGWIDVQDIKDYKTIEVEISKFFQVESTSEIPVLPHAAKKTNVTSGTTAEQLAWLYRVKQIAVEMIVPPASKNSIENAIESLIPLRISEAAIRKVPEILAKAGVRFVIVESLPSAKIDGVCFWLADNAPVIALTLRFNRIDNFWFVLRHELQHALLGHGKSIIQIDTELEKDNSLYQDIAEEEKLANEAAANFCVPSKKIESFIARKSPFFSERDLLGFAKINQIHPGLVVGQLQRRTGRYELFRKHLISISSYITPASVVDGWGTVAPTGI